MNLREKYIVILTCLFFITPVQSGVPAQQQGNVIPQANKHMSTYKKIAIGVGTTLAAIITSGLIYYFVIKKKNGAISVQSNSPAPLIPDIPVVPPQKKDNKPKKPAPNNLMDFDEPNESTKDVPSQKPLDPEKNKNKRPLPIPGSGSIKIPQHEYNKASKKNDLLQGRVKLPPGMTLEHLAQMALEERDKETNQNIPLTTPPVCPPACPNVPSTTNNNKLPNDEAPSTANTGSMSAQLTARSKQLKKVEPQEPKNQENTVSSMSKAMEQRKKLIDERQQNMAALGLEQPYDALNRSLRNRRKQAKESESESDSEHDEWESDNNKHHSD